MLATTPILFAVFLAVNVRAIIPLPCADRIDSFATRTCCPVLDLPDAGPCGANLGRGSCRPVAVPDSKFDAEQKDVRVNWPIQYFNSTCVCNERFGGVDCGECSYAYNDGGNCEQKTVLPRKSVGNMTGNEWAYYRAALQAVKFGSARYVVSTVNFTTDLETLMESLVRPTTYDLFTWIHYTAAKDNMVTLDTDHFVDYAHEGPGFPTWHRQLILWLEREIQVQIHDHTFRLPYWDWRDPSQREILFKRDRLGENVDGIVVGDLFTNWKTFCWENPTGLSYPVPLCDPTVSDNQILRRCPHPNTYLCERNGTNWPTYGDVKKALSIENYDTFPYTRFVEETGTSFRNYFEGFITRRGVDCGGDTMCTVDRVKNVTVVRKLHNSVHVVVGMGDFKTGLHIPFNHSGAMAFVASSPNDPVFVNHHIMVDCVLEQWIQRNMDSLSYPESDEIREGHRATDYIVSFIQLFMQKDMLKTADNFGYSCDLPKTH